MSEKTKKTESVRSAFIESVTQIRHILEDESGARTATTKHNQIGQLLQNYFDKEDVCDVYEGFLRLLIQMADLCPLSDYNIAVQVVQLFEKFYNGCPPFEKDDICGSMPEDKSVYLQALKVAVRFKPKHLKTVASVFRLDEEARKQTIVSQLIRDFVDANDVIKAVHWIIYFNLRDHFQHLFQPVVCHLLLGDETPLLDWYIGKNIYRRKRFISYLDKLIGMVLKFFQGYTELESLVLQDGRKLISTATKYLKAYDFPDHMVPNLLNLRARRALVSHFYKWQQGEISLENYENTALQSMEKNAYVHRYFLDYLCAKKMYNDALTLAIRLGDNIESIPSKDLRDYCTINKTAMKSAEMKVNREKECAEKLMVDEMKEKCELSNGIPIVWVNNWLGLTKAMDEIQSETIIGIDTEGMPHSHSVREKVALIQVATSTAVYLIDALVLNEMLVEDQWLTFFRILLCSKECRKIGFDFNNDLKFLKSTFPFIREVLPEMKSVVCLYRLLSQVQLIPEAAKLVFGSENFITNMSLFEVAKLLLGVKMDKSERIGNWAQRPLRLSQKIYAAMDANALIGCFRVVSERLRKLNDVEEIRTLTQAALVSGDRMLLDGQPQKNKEGGENHKEFANFVLKVSSHIRSAAPVGTLFKSADQVKLVVDSMLFGLGQQLRMCGFVTKMMNDRMRLIRYCEEHPEVTAVSAGKGYKEICQCLPSDRVMCVPINTKEAYSQLNSQLVGFVLRKLNILVLAENLFSRCVGCNSGSFCNLPKLVVKALFYVTAIQSDWNWIGIIAEDVENVLKELNQHALTARDCAELPMDGYSIITDHGQVICKCRECSVDVMNQLLNHGCRGPIEINMTIKLKEVFNQDGVEFRVCLTCGKTQYK